MGYQVVVDVFLFSRVLLYFSIENAHHIFNIFLHHFFLVFSFVYSYFFTLLFSLHSFWLSAIFSYYLCIVQSLRQKIFEKHYLIYPMNPLRWLTAYYNLAKC